MEKIEVAYGKMDAERAAESRATHDCDNLHQTAAQLRAPRHEQEQAARGAQTAAKAGSIMGDHRDQRRRNPMESKHIQTTES